MPKSHKSVQHNPESSRALLMPAFAPAPDLTTAVLLAQVDIGTRLNVQSLLEDCEEATGLTYGQF